VPGGRLGLTKCSYHFLYFNFTLTGTPFLSPVSYPDAIQVRDCYTGNLTSLTALSPSTAHKTLGMYKDPVGKHTSATKAFKEKSHHYARTLSRYSLTPVEAWTYYHSMYLPSMAFPLSSGYIADNQLNLVDHQLKNVLLPKLTYSRTSPLAVVFGSPPLGGISLRQHRIEQGLLKIKLFLKHWRTPHILAISSG
jgi:hypothetical protein